MTVIITFIGNSFQMNRVFLYLINIDNMVNDYLKNYYST
jgi:hypothetical protein